MKNRDHYNPTYDEIVGAKKNNVSDTEILLMCYAIPEAVSTALSRIAEKSKGAA